MKIACIANMNNNMFCLVRYLRDAGYDAHLFLVDEFDHFLPGKDAFDDDYKNYTHNLDWYQIGYWDIKPAKIKADLQGYDFVIGSDLVPAFMQKAGMVLDIFIPHGGDIFVHAFYRFKNFPPKRWEIGAKARSIAQKRGIRKSRYILFEYTNEQIEGYLNKIKICGTRFVSNAIYLYLPQYTESNFKKLDSYTLARKVRDENEIVIVHQCRHVWRPVREEFQYKGNDILFKAYAAFVKENPGKKSVLILFEYGWDYPESKQMIKDLGIEDRVMWLPVMLRKDIMVWLNIADICVGELGHSFLAYGSVYEDLALKKPFIGYRRDELYLKYYDTLYPMVSTNKAEEVAATFTELTKNPAKYVQMGQDAHAWLLKYAFERPLSLVKKAINDTQGPGD